MLRADTRFTILELKTENKAEVKPASMPSSNPSLYSKSKEKIMYRPAMTISPSNSSYFFIRLLLNQGSRSAAQSELVANPTRLTDTFDTRADPKKASQ